MSLDLLSTDELAALTGRRRATEQARFLRSRRIRHIVNAAGRVVVLHRWLEERGGEQQAPEPDFARLKERA